MNRLPLRLAALLALIAGQAFAQSITIGAGPVIGTDANGTQFRQEFQDWARADVRWVHPVSGTSPRYNWNDGFDDARDLNAFYVRTDTNNVYFRVDLYDLKIGDEAGLDLYVGIDCALGGQFTLPDGAGASWNQGWERILAIYSPGTVGGSNYNYYQFTGGTSNTGYLGSYWNSELDSIEFGVAKSTLPGWDGNLSNLQLIVWTRRDMSPSTGSSTITDCIPDLDRGFSDAIVNGNVAANAALVPGTTGGIAKWASIAHGNQSVNQADDTRIHIWDPTNAFITGFHRALDTHEMFNVPLNIHVSGSLLIAAKWAIANPAGGTSTTETPASDGPAFINRVRDFVDSNQTSRPGALVGGVLAEHIMPYFDGAVNVRSQQLFNELMLHHFGLTPAQVPVMHVPERTIGANANTNSFPDILAAGYKATYIDEVTHYHWWFNSANTVWTGAGGSDSLANEPDMHKIQKIHGVLCFLINDREDQAKFGNSDNGALLDTRFTLTNKARSSDQAQLVLVFDDWEAMSGKSFDPVSGISTPNNNQQQYHRTVRWLANKQWIEIVTLNEIYDRATNIANAQYSASWVIDRDVPAPRTDLSVQCYEWLKHASEGSYHYWYYNKNIDVVSQPTGIEQDFFNLVPVITGNQGDYYRRFTLGQIGFRPINDTQANSVDGPKIPSNIKFGDIKTNGTLMKLSWDAIQAAPNNNLRKIAEYCYTNMIYETAWHEQVGGAYQNTNYQNPFPNPDTDWDGMNTWALRLHNHIRKVRTLTEAAQWAEQVRTGAQGAATVAINADIDFDGEDEYILKNNKAFGVFERHGGRLTHAFVYNPAINDAYMMVGSPVANPSEPGEEERTGNAANRCSAFKEVISISGTELADMPLSGGNVLSVSSPAGWRFTMNPGSASIQKTITLPDNSSVFVANYQQNTAAGNVFTRVGLSVNHLDLIKTGQTNLTVERTSTRRGVINSAGGAAYVELVSGPASFNDTPFAAGWNNRNLALTEEVEFSSGGGPVNYTVNLRLATAPVASVDGWEMY